MSIYFKKIDLDLSDIDLKKLNSGIIENRPYNLNFYYNKITDLKILELLRSRLPSECKPYVNSISYCIIRAPFYVPPHVDKKSLSVINYYHQPGTSETRFYEINNTHPQPYKFGNVYYEGSFDLNDIEMVDKFKADAGDCYILDVSRIHDVTVSEGEDRCFINYSFTEKI